MIQDKLQTIGMSQFGMTEKPYCQVCQRFGHLYDNCYYNPEFRGRRPEYITQKIREVAANVIAPQGANRRYQGPAPPRRFQNPNNWGYQNRGQNIVQQLPCTYCGTIGHRQGPDCDLWCIHRNDRGIPIIRYNNNNNDNNVPPPQNQQPLPQQQRPPGQVNLVILEEVREEPREEQVSGPVLQEQECQFVQGETEHYNCDCSLCIQIEDIPETSAVLKHGHKV